jgi:thiamine-phosphate pyrophosphorylase
VHRKATNRRFPILYTILDVDHCARTGWEPRDLARALLAGGSRLLQLRAKTMAGGMCLDLAAAIVEDARAVGAAVIVNDRVDLAVLAGAAGVHVGQEDLSPEDVRKVAGPGMTVGLSTHTREQIEHAIVAPISYFAIGPVFSTATKHTGYESVGLDAVRHAADRGAEAKLPVVAIGGITLDTAPAVIDAGAASVAVITDLVTSDPEKRVRQYLAALR